MPWRYIIWDWNGTILDDVCEAVAVNNEIFPGFGLKPIGDIEQYKKIFTFPIRDYYGALGVTDDIFDQVAQAWMTGYMAKSEGCGLQPGVIDALEAFSQNNLKQIILSASQRDNLIIQIAKFPIGHYFQDILGLDNIYATSKVALAQAYLNNKSIAPNEALIIGDTLHDAEVAKAIGCDCLLIANGHQTRERLEAAGCPVFDSLAEGAGYIINLNKQH